MRKYRQLTSGERYALQVLRKQGCTQADIARTLERAPSTISRELRRNRRPGRHYSAFEAGQQTRGRWLRSRRNQRFTPADWTLVLSCLEELWSPEQISGRLYETGELTISHESIYRFVWLDKKQGGALYLHLRQAGKKRRKRYGRYDSRGRLAGKRHISERPPGAHNRSRLGHWEADTVVGPDKHCILTLVEFRVDCLGSPERSDSHP